MTAPKNAKAERIQEIQGQPARPEPTNLVRRYGDIGIGALAAALRYATSTKKPASAQATTRVDERFLEQTA